MADAIELIRSGKLPERTVPICLAGDLAAQHEELTRQLAAAVRAATDSLEGDPESARLADEIAALEELMAESTVTFRLRALPRARWATLVAEHPARKDDSGKPIDIGGFNPDSFVAEGLRECLVDPALDDELWNLLIEERLTDGQYEQLTSAFWELNRSGVSVPFSRAASRIRQGSAQK